MTHPIRTTSDSDIVRELIGAAKSGKALTDRLGLPSPHPIYHAAKQGPTFIFKKSDLREAIHALYREWTGTQDFAEPIQSRLDALKAAYEDALEADEAVADHGKERIAAIVSDIWCFLNVSQGNFTNADDPVGTSYLSGTICFIVLILRQKKIGFKLNIPGLPEKNLELAKRGERDLGHALDYVELPDHAIRIAVTRIALCQKRWEMRGFGSPPSVADVIQDDKQRLSLLELLMQLVEVPLPRKAAVLNAIKIASSLRKKKECCKAVEVLIRLDARFSDPNYKGWSMLNVAADDPDLKFYRDVVVPTMSRGVDQ